MEPRGQRRRTGNVENVWKRNLGCDAFRRDDRRRAFLSAWEGPSLATSPRIRSSGRWFRPSQPLTRGLSVAPQADPAAVAAEGRFVENHPQPGDPLAFGRRARRNRHHRQGQAEYRSGDHLRLQFRQYQRQIAAAVQALGKALTNPDLKGSTFIVAGHTDAAGTEGYNQDLSERRADSIKRYLVDNSVLPAPTSSPSVTARPSSRIRRTRWER